MAQLQCQRCQVGNTPAEIGGVAQPYVSAIRARAMDGEVGEAAYAGLAGKQVLAGGVAPQGGQLVDGLADADADVFTALVPAALPAHDLAPHRQHPVAPVIRSKTHAAVVGAVSMAGNGGHHQRLQGAVVQIDVVG